MDYSITKQQKLEKYVEKFNYKKRTEHNGGDSKRTSTNKHNPKR